jgi:Uma2 family endonuclease
MTTKPQLSLEEYLETTFENGDCDYVEGEVIERQVGKVLHSFVQAAVLQYLLSHPRRLLALPEIRIAVGESRYRVADVAAWSEGRIGTGIPKVLPFLAVEVLSPGESFIYIQEKIQDYLRAGIADVWVIDPWKREAMQYSREIPGGRALSLLRTSYSDVEMNTADLWVSLPSE